MAATITPQHLLFNRNDMLVGGIKPHFYCLPILKRQTHQTTLLEVATSGNPKFFLGTDSAPHAQNAKENACGCAGCYSAPNAIELYAQAFDQVGKLERLEGFASHFGADFYGLPRNTSTITLVKEDNLVPESFDYLDNQKSSRCMPGKRCNGEKCDTRKLCPGHWPTFSWLLPVVVDVETAGFNAQTDALLEIACIPIVYDAQGQFVPGPAFHAHINPLKGLTSTAVR